MVYFFKKPIITLISGRDLIARAVLSELKKKNAGSVLGIAWLVISPMIFMAVYSAVYLYIFKMRPMQMTQSDYLLYIFSGLIPFLSISEGISLGTTSLISEASVLKSSSFPAEIIPLKGMLSGQSSLVLGLLILLVASFSLGHFSLALLSLPWVLFMQMLFLAGVVWVTSISNLAFRDTQPILSYLIMILMLASPIGFTPDRIPSMLKPMLWLNPFAYFIRSYQSILVLETVPVLSLLVPMTLFSFLSFFLGIHFFWTAKKAAIEYA